MMTGIDWEALEQEFRPFEPGTQVLYSGSIEQLHGLWVVRAEIGDEYYNLRHPTNEWQRLNANREDLTRVEDQ